MAAELQQSPTQQPATQNFAPVKPLLEIKRGGKKPASYIQKAIKERWDHFHRKDKDVFREIFNVGQLCNLMINGKQFLCRNPVDGSWGVLPIATTSNDHRALNILNNIKTNLLGKWENSNPDILIRPGRNLDTCIAAARSADTINNYYERQFYNHWFSQQEAMYGMTFGTYIDRYRFDDTKVSMSVIQDIFEQKETSFGEGIGYCADCEFMGHDSSFKSAMGGEGPFSRAMCPQCRSTAVEVIDAPKGELFTATGKTKKQVGDLVCELLPLPACRWDLSKRPEDSGWFIYSQTIPRGAVTRVMGNVLLPEGQQQDDGLDVLRALGKQGQAMSGYSNYGNQRSREDDKSKGDEATFHEFWMSPDDYADINLIGDEETVEGEKLPKGKLTDVFPNGLCAVGLNGMSVVLALYGERHRDHIVSGTWFIQTATGAGRGLADTVEVQKQFNTGNNQAMSYMASTFTPAVMYDNQILTGSKMKYIGTPKTNIPVDLTRLPEGRKLADAIHQFSPSTIPNQFFNYFQDFLGFLAKKTSGASDYDQGDPGIAPSNPTATAAEIDQGNADAFNQPIFLIKADARKRGAEITINLFRQHFPMKRYFDLGGEFGEQEGVELAAADVQADLIYGVVPNSEMPQGPYTRRKNRMQFFNAVGGFEGLLMANQSAPRMLAATARDFDVDIELNQNYDAVAIISRKRLNQMTGAVKLGANDPAIILEAIQPPISPVEPDLADGGKWFSRWLTTDQGQNAPMPLRLAVEVLVQKLISGQVAQRVEIASGEGRVAAAQAAPMAVGGAMLEQEMSPEQSPNPDPTATLQAEQELATQERELMDNAAQRQHEKEMLRLEGERDAKVAKVDADNKIRVERSKPRPTAKPVSKGAKKK